jgi:hypothetical protein
VLRQHWLGVIRLNGQFKTGENLKILRATKLYFWLLHHMLIVLQNMLREGIK